jgi:dUTP pyrophosphatase
MEQTFIICKFREDACSPKKMSEGAAGYDIITPSRMENVEILPGCWKAIETGIGVIIPNGYYGRVAPRSSLAFKYGISVMAGVIDCDYRGELKVILHNNGKENVIIKGGDRVAQIILEKITLPNITEINMSPEKFKEEYSTERGDGGFGSTGR